MLVLIMQSFNALLFVFLTKIGDQIRLLEMKKKCNVSYGINEQSHHQILRFMKLIIQLDDVGT